MKYHPRGYGGERRSADDIKRDGWRETGLLAVSAEDPRLPWPERELIRQLGEKLYGLSSSTSKVHHGSRS